MDVSLQSTTLQTNATNLMKDEVKFVLSCKVTLFMFKTAFYLHISCSKKGLSANLSE